MNNIRKAAILLEGVGEPHTSRILGMLSNEESLKVIQEMAKITEVSEQDYKEVFSEALKVKNIKTYGKKGDTIKN